MHRTVCWVLPRWPPRARCTACDGTAQSVAPAQVAQPDGQTLPSILLVGNPALSLKGFDCAIATLALVHRSRPIEVRWASGTSCLQPGAHADRGPGPGCMHAVTSPAGRSMPGREESRSSAECSAPTSAGPLPGLTGPRPRLARTHTHSGCSSKQVHWVCQQEPPEQLAALIQASGLPVSLHVSPPQVGGPLVRFWEERRCLGPLATSRAARSTLGWYNAFGRLAMLSFPALPGLPAP